jgi:hypothetical protein
MSDDSMPFEKAAEETAKAASNAVDLIREGGRAIGPAIGEIYGLLIGDRVSAARDRRLDEIARKTKKILKDRDVAEQQELPEDIAIPILEAAQGEPRDELQELWARLLANAMDPKRSNNVRANFIDTIRQFEPVDARILFHVQSLSEGDWPMTDEIANSLKIRESTAELSVDHLVRLECLQRHTANQNAVHLTFFGLELLYGIEP